MGFEVSLPAVTAALLQIDNAEPAASVPNANETTLPSAKAASVTHSALPDSTTDISVPVESISEAAATPDFLPPGRLTRLPTPLGEIDLDVPALNQFSFTGALEFSILIDENGVVVDVLSLAETEGEAIFSDRVAERFKHARFSPGEIDGRAVKSQVRIMVVSEDLSASGN